MCACCKEKQSTIKMTNLLHKWVSTEKLKTYATCDSVATKMNWLSFVIMCILSTCGKWNFKILYIFTTLRQIYVIDITHTKLNENDHYNVLKSKENLNHVNLDEIQEYGIHEERSLMASLQKIFSNMYNYIYKFIKYLQCIFLMNFQNKVTYVFGTIKSAIFKFIATHSRQTVMLLVPIIRIGIKSAYSLLMPLIKKLLCKVLAMLENIVYLM